MTYSSLFRLNCLPGLFLLGFRLARSSSRPPARTQRESGADGDAIMQDQSHDEDGDEKATSKSQVVSAITSTLDQAMAKLITAHNKLSSRK